MSKAIFEQHDIKNTEAAQKVEVVDEFTKAAHEAEDAHTKYFETRHTNPEFTWDKENKLWLEYLHTHKVKLAYIIGKMDGSKSERDPNDYQADDKVPADPQEREMNESSNY